MCGIGGFYKSKNILDLDLTTEKLVSALHHRGPDGSGYFTDEDITLVHTRLSIIDLSENGNQPLFNEDRSLVLICNGEIYNYRELTSFLVQKGHKFHSSSDSEVLLHLYEEFNGNIEEVVSKIKGMFAFAIWDISRKRLVIVRDRLGIKPLFYIIGEGFAFSSEIKPLISSGLSQGQLDPTSLYEYLLLGSIPEPNTWYKDIKCLAPGSYAIYENEKVVSKQYWNIDTKINVNFKSHNEVKEETDFLLRKITKDHLVADVEVGTFLSGGIDSSLISYYAAELNRGIYSFSAAFPGEPEDESEVAATTSKKINSTHKKLEIRTDFFEDFDTHFANMDQPFGISSSLSLSRISKLARKDVKVVLSGDGADELMAGYHRHIPFYSPSLLRGVNKSLKVKIFKNIGKIFNKKSLLDLATYLEYDVSDLYINRFIVEQEHICLELINPDLHSEIDTNRYKSKVKKLWNQYGQDDFINNMLYVDVKSSLVDEMLTKVDRVTLNQGIEARVPFLDHRFVNFSFSVPSKFKRDDKFGKLPLRELVEDKLGKQLAYRIKTGFNSPIKKMLLEDDPTWKIYDESLSDLKKSNLLNNTNLNNLACTQRGEHINPSLAFALHALAHYLGK